MDSKVMDKSIVCGFLAHPVHSTTALSFHLNRSAFFPGMPVKLGSQFSKEELLGM